MVSKFILTLGFIAACFGQNSYTTTQIHPPPGVPIYGLTWISDDAKTGFGGGLVTSPFMTQCITYQDGLTTALSTPGFQCSAGPATTGIYVMSLSPYPAVSSGSVQIGNVVAYTNGKFNPIPPPPDGITFYLLSSVNKKGQIAATMRCPIASVPGASLPCAYLITVDGTYTRLPDMGGVSSVTGINDAGDAVGYVVPLNGDPYLDIHAVLWPHTGGMTDLTTLTSMKLGAPAGINSKGQIAGSSAYGPGDVPGGPGFFYDAAGNFSPILISGASSVRLTSINDRGEVVGSYRTPAGIGLDYPLYYSNGVSKDLNTAIANLPVDMYLSAVSYINNVGQMVVGAVFSKQPIGAVDNGTQGSQFLLTPSNATVLPLVGSVKNAASHLDGVASSAWIEIKGQNLAPSTRSWSAADFIGNKLPTGLEGVSVTINGVPAYPNYVSPIQVNVLAPDDPATGQVQVQVINSQGASIPFTVAKSEVLPALFNTQGSASSANTPGLVIATHADGRQVAMPSVFGCTAACSPANPGETIVLYGTGFGATKTPVPAGQLVGTPVGLENQVSVTIGGQQAAVNYAGRTSSGLDQLNVVLPSGMQTSSDGSALVVATVKGVKTPDYLYIATTIGQ